MTRYFQLVFPLTWVDEGADIDAENLKKAKGLLVTPIIAVDAVTGILTTTQSVFCQNKQSRP